MTPDTLITVCDKCHRASCWQGIFMCDAARTADTRQMTVAQLRAGHFGEHEDYWKTDEQLARGQP
jgi:hypothetical protein